MTTYFLNTLYTSANPAAENKRLGLPYLNADISHTFIATLGTTKKHILTQIKEESRSSKMFISKS